MNSLFRTMGRKTLGSIALLALMQGVSDLPAQTSSDSFAQGGWKARGSQAAPKIQEPSRFQEAVQYEPSPKFQEAPKPQAAPSKPVAPVQAEIRRTSAEEAFDDAPADSRTPPKLFEAPMNQVPVAQPSDSQAPPWQRPQRRRPAPPGRQVRYQPGYDRVGPMQSMNMRMQPAPEPIAPGARSRAPQGPTYSGPQSGSPQTSGPQPGPTYMPDGYTPGDGSWIDGPQDWSSDPMDGGSYGDGSCGGPGCCGGPCDPYYEYGRPGLLDGLVGSIFQHPGWCMNTDGCYQPYGWWRPWVVFDESSVFLGTTSFKGPVDTGAGQSGPNGNFGFQEGFNLAGAFLDWCGIGYQVGGNFTQSNFHGDFVLTVRPDSRAQQFYTVGLFHRAWYGHGLQYGVVGDWLRDHYYVNYDLSQVRAEISYLNGCGHEIGYWGIGNNTQVTVTANNVPIQQTLQPTNVNALFYRYTTYNGSQGRFWLGGAGTKQGILGADFRVPISNRWDLNGRFNYIIPNEPAGRVGLQNEIWGMAVNLVWYPGRAANGIHNGPYRPLFNVADNTTFFVHRQQ